MTEGSNAVQSAMQKLDGFFAGLPPEEQDVIADLVRRAAQQAVEGAEVEGYIILHGFPEALTMNNTPSLFRALGQDENAVVVFKSAPRQPGHSG